MAVKNTAQVVIGGKIITLGGYESEGYLQTVASYMNNKISSFLSCPVTIISQWRPSICC